MGNRECHCASCDPQTDAAIRDESQFRALFARFIGATGEYDRNKRMGDPGSRRQVEQRRRDVGADNVADKVESSRPRVEYPLGAKRYSRGEPGEVTKPGGGGAYRTSHGEWPPRLQEDKEAMRAQIRRNLGLQDDESDEDEELARGSDEDEAEGAVARVKARKTVKASGGLRGLVLGSQGCSLREARNIMVATAVKFPGGVNDQVLRNLALGQPWRGPCPD